jgi:hypothetical protein
MAASERFKRSVYRVAFRVEFRVEHRVQLLRTPKIAAAGQASIAAEDGVV